MKAAAVSEKIDEQVMTGIWAQYLWSVQLSQALIISLEQEAMWAIASGYTTSAMPNYLDYIHADALRALKPNAVTLIQ